MNILKDVNTSSIVAIDIETVRVKEKYEELDDITKMAWSYKFKRDGNHLSGEELSVEWVKSASLYAEFSKVCSVSLVFLYDGKPVHKTFGGPNEEDILKELGTTLDNMYLKGVYKRLVGHSSKFFDYPYLCKRFVINGLGIPHLLDTTNLKPWENLNLDTNDIWKMGGTGYGSSLLALCNVLNIPISKVDLLGDEVGETFYNKEYQRINDYCILDTLATFNVIRRFKGESIFTIDELKPAPSSKNINPFVRLYTENYLSDAVKERIQELMAGKKFTKKEMDMLTDILVGVYTNVDMFKGDNAEIVKSKEAEVKEFIKTLTNGKK
nr:MAG TPA: DNA polymerase B [Bacteriophage sp.]